MGAGGPPHRALDAIRRDYPVSLHGVCMSIGGPHPLNKAHLERFCRLVERYEPALVSEHLAWSTHETAYFNDLLPLPYTAATLTTVCDHIDEVQQAIGQRMLLENPSTYVAFRESTMSETDSSARSRAEQDAACCWTSTTSLFRRQPRFFRARISGGLPAFRGRGNPSRRALRTERRRGRSSYHRQPRWTGRRRGVEAVRDRHRANRPAADPDRMGQQYSRMARP